jgi:hypothetical protein
MFETIKQNKSAICFGSEKPSYTGIKAERRHEVLCTEVPVL